MTYLHVKFRQGLTGNLNRREVKFFDQTKTIYGPVAGWGDQLDDTDLTGLGAKGMSLEADALDVRQMPGPPGTKRGYFELDATGSIFAESQRFTAQGTQLTYVERNDKLALHGSPAEMFMENQNGGQRQEYRATLVEYWFADHRVRTTGVNLLNVVIPNANQPKAPAKPIVTPPATQSTPPAMNALPPSASGQPR